MKEKKVLETFRTQLINKRPTALVVYEMDGPMLTLLPGDTTMIETKSPFDMYAKWDSVSWEADGTVILEERPGWKEPSRGTWEVTVLNADGKPVEHLTVSGKIICLPRGIPIVLGVDAHDPLVLFRELKFIAVPIKERSKEWPGYLVTRKEVRWVVTDRKPQELDEIKALIDAELKGGIEGIKT
jgi:hypothetical protein